MIRAETATDWIVITHPDHAYLAGLIADAWGNESFAPPEPFPAARYAVYHHDDGWLARDAAPTLTPNGKPEAFTRDLVGAYSAFEEIDLPSYLQVRGKATAAVAEVNEAAGVLVSMHTVNLLTEQADIATIRPEHRPAHADFLAHQRSWQNAVIERLGLEPAAMQRGFEFLQCCDNLSLILCSAYDQPRALRHSHPDRDGVRHELICQPTGAGAWSISPWPFSAPRLEFEVPHRILPKSQCTDTAAYRTAFAAAPIVSGKVTLTAG